MTIIRTNLTLTDPGTIVTIPTWPQHVEEGDIILFTDDGSSLHAAKVYVIGEKMLTAMLTGDKLHAKTKAWVSKTGMKEMIKAKTRSTLIDLQHKVAA